MYIEYSTHIRYIWAHTNSHTICTYIQLHARTHAHTHNTYLHLRTRGCYSTDGIRANGLYHIVKLLSLNGCHLSGLCDLRFITYLVAASLALVNLSNSDCYNEGTEIVDIN